MSAPPIVHSELERAYTKLDDWCRRHDYTGHDPFDALNSALFQAAPRVLRSSRPARLIWTQAFKRSPVNLRKLARVPEEKNAKGTALFALAALSEFRKDRKSEAERKARSLLSALLEAQLQSESGAACWGYNFDWQGRAFFAPKGTPTIVPTAFAARALIEAAREFGEEYLKPARSACDFILCDLNLSAEHEEEVCWSYSPLDSTRVFNASLLAAETLASVGALTNEKELVDWAVRGALYVARRQNEDGSWAYGADTYQSWSDNFHTAFILTSLARIIGASESAREELRRALARGYEFWRERFFLSNGWPKYYPDRLYPADAHSAGAALAALAELSKLDESAHSLAERIALWAIDHLQSAQGFFYYQRRRFYRVRTPYMRWSQAWMLYGLARLLESKQ